MNDSHSLFRLMTAISISAKSVKKGSEFNGMDSWFFIFFKKRHMKESHLFFFSPMACLVILSSSMYHPHVFTASASLRNCKIRNVLSKKTIFVRFLLLGLKPVGIVLHWTLGWAPIIMRENKNLH